MAGCASDEAEDEAAAEEFSAHDEYAPAPENGVTFTRSGGSTFEIHDGAVDCGPADEDEEVTVVRMSAPATISRRGRKVLEPFLIVTAEPGSEGSYELPLDGGDLSEGRTPPVTIFGVDSEDGNELSGSVEVSTGAVRILEATCDPSPTLSFTIRATLGSEYGDMPTMHVEGGLDAPTS